MRKRLIFRLALVFVLFQIAPEVPLLARDKNDSASHADNARTQNPVSPQAIVQQINSPQGQQKERQQGSVSSHAPLDYVAWGFWVNLTLTAITFLIALASLIQARAAKLGATAVLRSERAWLLLDGDKVGMPYLSSKTRPYCSLALRNCGNTPAQAIDFQFELQMGDSAEVPPSFEIYSRGVPKDSLTPFPIGQDRLGQATAGLMPEEPLTESVRTEIREGKKIIWLCGVARYHDVFEQKQRFKRRKEEHHTFVCLRYRAMADGSSGDWVLGGPPGYNKAT